MGAPGTGQQCLGASPAAGLVSRENHCPQASLQITQGRAAGNPNIYKIFCVKNSVPQFLTNRRPLKSVWLKQTRFSPREESFTQAMTTHHPPFECCLVLGSWHLQSPADSGTLKADSSPTLFPGSCHLQLSTLVGR